MKQFKFKTTLLSCVMAMGFAFSVRGEEKPLIVKSPDNHLEIKIMLGDTLRYTVSSRQQVILAPSAIGLVMGNGDMKGAHPKLVSQKPRSAHDTIVSPNYRFSSFDVTYNELQIQLKDGLGVIFRAYNEGVAYRFVMSMKGNIDIKDEVAQFNFNNDYVAYLPYSTGTKDVYATAYQNTYDVKPLTQANTKLPAFLPVLVDYGTGTKLTITESDLESYPGMFIRANGTKQFKGEFARLPLTTAKYPWRQQDYVTSRDQIIAKTKGTRQFPWRVMVVSEKDTDLPVSNLVYALATPNQIGDYSWVKPGKSAWDWWNDWGISHVGFNVGINTQT